MSMSAAPSAPASKRAAVSGALYLGVTQVVRLVVTTLSTIVIARLLSPGDYGVLAMTAPVIALVYMFQDLGLNAATIQRASVSQNESSALFWINVSASVILAATLILVAPAVAWFYADARPGWVTAASGLVLITTSLQMQHVALLDRELRFGVICAVEVANALVTFLVSVLAAYWLRSYWALMIGSLAGAVTQTSMIWVASRFRPNRRVSLRGAGNMLAFGRHLTGFNVLNLFVRNADNVLIAKFAGADALGLYDRSYKLMMMPLQNINAPISRLLLPLLSRLRDEPVRYRRSFLFSVRMVILASAPGIAIATVLSDRLMPFLLGERWAAAGPIFAWLGLTGLIQPAANMTGVLYLSTGRTKAMAQWGLISAVVTLAGFFIGLQWGVIGVAASLFVTAFIRLPAIFILSTRGTSITAFDLARAQAEPLLGAGCAAIIAYYVAPHMTIVPLLCSMIPTAYVLALASSSITAEGRHVTATMCGLVGDVIDPMVSRLLTLSRRGRRIS